jgi:hypothetical protein
VCSSRRAVWNGGIGCDPARVRATVLLLLRLGVGVFLVVLAFTEKLLASDLARQLLTDQPHLDPLQQLGLAGRAGPVPRGGVRDRALPGAADPGGVAPQVLATAVPFHLTLAFFDRFELIGHLPIYGALLAVLNYGSDPAPARTVPIFGRRR